MKPFCTLLLAWLLAIAAGNAWSYGWLSHWRVMEAKWPDVTKNLCPRGTGGQFPAFKSLSEYERNHAAVGAVISDFGYVVPGTRQFSDLLHYVGAGEFTKNLIEVVCEQYPTNRAMLALAAGFRTHYWADRIGHYEGTNVSAAKLSPKGSPFLGRMAYEEDPRTHRMLEIASFSLFDLRNGATEAALAFVNIVGSDIQWQVIANALTEAMKRTYGDAATRLVPAGPQLLFASFSVLQSVCTTVDKVYAGGTANNVIALATSCRRRMQGKDLPPDSAPKQPLLDMIDEGLLKAKEAWLEAVYEESVRHVEAALVKSGLAEPINFNIDTNLPSVGGQYHGADRAFSILVNVGPARCDSKALERIALGKPSSWRDYQTAGVCVGQLVRRTASEANCAELLADADLKLMVDAWLSDIRPDFGGSPPSRSQGCRAATSGGANPLFRVDEKCRISATQPMSPVDFLYGYGALSEQGRTSNERRRIEAGTRLRIRDAIDPSTGLHQP